MKLSQECILVSIKLSFLLNYKFVKKVIKLNRPSIGQIVIHKYLWLQIYGEMIKIKDDALYQ